jgi:hypothetical protein
MFREKERVMKNTNAMGLMCVAVLLSLASAAMADFSYPDFSSTAGVNLVGSAAQSGDHIRLVPATMFRTGGVWTQAQQSVGSGFATTFEVQMTNIGGELDATGKHGTDYISFAVQNAGNNIPAAPYDGTGSRLTVNLDCWKNANTIDLGHCTVFVALNGVVQTATNLEALGISLTDEAVHQVSITYAEQVLNVLVDNTAVTTISGVDLNACGLGSGYAGFMGRNGGATYANEDVLSWSFQSVPEPATFLLLGIGGMVLRRRRL